MFVELSREDELTAFVSRILRDESAEFKRRLVAALSHLDEAGWLAMEQMVLELASGHAAANQQPQGEKPVPPGYSSRAELEVEADEFAAIAREQFLSEKIPGYQASYVHGSGDLLA